MHALVTAVLLRAPGLDALDGAAEPEPPDGELGEIEEAVRTGEGHAVVGPDRLRQAALLESCSKAVTARSSRVDSSASQSQRKREAWSVTVSG
jgi:hypothetical protein